jgi:hypothetical protein
MASTKELILGTAIIVPTTTLAARYIKHKPLPIARVLLSSLAVAIFLSLTAMAADDVARALAWLIIIGALITNGATVAGKINATLK